MPRRRAPEPAGIARRSSFRRSSRGCGSASRAARARERAPRPPAAETLSVQTASRSRNARRSSAIAGNDTTSQPPCRSTWPARSSSCRRCMTMTIAPLRLVVEPRIERRIEPVVGRPASALGHCVGWLQRVVDEDHVGAAAGQHAADRSRHARAAACGRELGQGLAGRGESCRKQRLVPWGRHHRPAVAGEFVGEVLRVGDVDDGERGIVAEEPRRQGDRSGERLQMPRRHVDDKPLHPALAAPPGASPPEPRRARPAKSSGRHEARRSSAPERNRSPPRSRAWSSAGLKAVMGAPLSGRLPPATFSRKRERGSRPLSRLRERVGVRARPLGCAPSPARGGGRARRRRWRRPRPAVRPAAAPGGPDRRRGARKTNCVARCSPPAARLTSCFTAASSLVMRRRRPFSFASTFSPSALATSALKAPALRPPARIAGLPGPEAGVPPGLLSPLPSGREPAPSSSRGVGGEGTDVSDKGRSQYHNGYSRLS